MKKRILSLLLCLVMALSLVPMTVFAGNPVSNLRWDGTVARWDTDGSATQYRVILECDTRVTLDNRIVETNSVDYTDYMLPGNTYRYIVAPIVGTEQLSLVTGPRVTIPGSKGTILVTVNADTKTATWPAVSGADGYDVWIIKNGGQIGSVKHIGGTFIDFYEDYITHGGGNYTIRVKAYKIHRGNYLAEGTSQEVKLEEVPDYTISFDMNGHGIQIEPLSVNERSYAEKPADPTEEGWLFRGWYLDEYGMYPYDFSRPVTESLTLYAEWSRIYTCTVMVSDDEAGTACASPTSGIDETIVTLTATPNAGYKFKEWQRVSGLLSDISNATSATTSITIRGFDVTVMAVFEKVDSVLLGDVDGNGKVNMVDVTKLRQYLTNKTKYPLAVEAAADVDNSGKINMVDVTKIRQYLTNKDKYPLG